DGGAADVHADLAGADGLKRLLLTGQGVVDAQGHLHLKSEIRNPKSETNPKSESEPMTETDTPFVLNLLPWSLGFVSDFGFRISDFLPFRLMYPFDERGRLAPDRLGPADVADLLAGLGLDIHRVRRHP